MRTAVPCLVLALVAAGCATTVRADAKSRPGVDFTGFSTFDWLPPDEERPPDAFAQNPAADRRLRALIERELRAKGLTRASEGPDLFVTYVTGVKDDLGETVWGQGYGGVQPGGGRGAQPRREATLIVDLVRVEPRELVWRGWAKATIQQFQDADPIATEAIEKLFALYPPRR